MKVLFLDIDGVVNCRTTKQRHRGFIGIDPFLAFIVGKITLEVHDLKVVLSSSWRHMADGRKEVCRQVVPIFDVTSGKVGSRGEQIQDWLDKHTGVEKYAILDDDSDILESQLENFFRTTWEEGITPEIGEAVIKHLK